MMVSPLLLLAARSALEKRALAARTPAGVKQASLARLAAGGLGAGLLGYGVGRWTSGSRKPAGEPDPAEQAEPKLSFRQRFRNIMNRRAAAAAGDAANRFHNTYSGV